MIQQMRLEADEGKISFRELVELIQKKSIHPEDAYEIAAIIESMGWNDERAADDFGVADVFELAEKIWMILQNGITTTSFVPEKKKRSFLFFIDAVRSFLRGLIFAFPMAISVFSMLTLGFSLWAYENLSTEDATSIAIGTILSFMTVGGFTQAIARRGFFYIVMGYYNMAKDIILHFVKVGYIVCILIAGLFLVMNSFFEFFPYRMYLKVVIYFLFLSAIWLSVTVMYILRKEILFTGLLVFGIFLVYIFLLFGLNIILAQVISLGIIAIVGLVCVVYLFKKAERKMEKGIAPARPKLSYTLYDILPYFIYGFTYFTFLYTDRIIAWSTNVIDYMPYIIWFRGQYELGLDFALLVIIFPMGYVELLIDRMIKSFEVAEKNISEANSGELNKLFLSRYYRSIVNVLIFSVLSAALIFVVFMLMDKYSAVLVKGQSILSNATTWFVFIIATVSYCILSVGLMNAIILFSVSQPKLVIHSILPALSTNVCVGFVCSRWMVWVMKNDVANTVSGYSFAIMGLLAGSVVFSVISSKKVVSVLNKLDYYLYAQS